MSKTDTTARTIHYDPPADDALYQHPTAVVEFPAVDGALVVWATSEHHAGARTEHAHNVTRTPWPEEVTARILPAATLSRVEYTVRLDLHPADHWIEHKPGYGIHRLAEPWTMDTQSMGYALSRASTYGGDHGTDAARAQLLERIAEPFAAWLNSDDGKRLLADAEAMRRREIVAAATGKAIELRNAANELDDIADDATAGRPLTWAAERFAKYARLDRAEK